MASPFTINATINSFGGRFLKLTHQSTATGTPMNLALYLPPSAAASKPAPLLIYLSSLTCSPDNVTEQVSSTPTPLLSASASSTLILRRAALTYPGSTNHGILVVQQASISMLLMSYGIKLTRWNCISPGNYPSHFLVLLRGSILGESPSPDTLWVAMVL